jgi:hypothetical protein
MSKQACVGDRLPGWSFRNEMRPPQASRANDLIGRSMGLGSSHYSLR